MDEKLRLLLENEDFIAELLSKEEPEDVQKLFADNDVELSIEEIKDIGKALEKVDTENGELSEDDLEEVAGGMSVIAIIKGITTVIKAASFVKRNWGRIKRFFRRW